MKPYMEFDGLQYTFPDHTSLENIRALRNEESTWTHLTDPRPLGSADQKAWIESIGAKSGRYYFVVSDESHPFIGLVRMDEHDLLHRSIRVGADVTSELRGVGYGHRIYRGIFHLAFNHFGVHRVWLQVLSTNTIAKNLYAKLGFSVEGSLREAVWRGGRFVDYVLMSILEGEYRNGSPV